MVSPESTSAIRAFGDRILLWALVLMMIARTCSNMVTSDPDLWGHVLYGLDHLKSGQLARSDPYSYTARGATWINHEWLSELIFAWSWQQFGATGLWAIRLILVATTMLILVRLISESTRGLWCGVLTLAACWIEMNRGFAIRPQLFTMAMLAVLLLAIRRIFERPTWPLAAAFSLPPLMCVWANLHGGFVVGLALLAFLLFHQVVEVARGRAPRRRALVTLAAVGVAMLSTLVNPYGWRLWVQVLAAPAGGRIGEWGSMLSFHPLYLLVGFYATLALLAVATPAMLRAGDWFEWGVLIVLAAAAIVQTRHGPLFCLAAAAWLPTYLEAALPRLAVPPRFPRLFVAGVTAIALLYAAGSHLGASGRPYRLLVPISSHPIDAYRFVRASGLHGNVLVDFDWAQSALWYLHDTCKIAYDGRFNTVYPRGVEDDYFRFHFGGADWTGMLDRYDPQIVLMPRGWAAFEQMKRRSGWVAAYEGESRVSPLDGSDATPVVFVRGGIRASSASGGGPAAAGGVFEFGVALN